MPNRRSFEIGGISVEPGTRKTIDLPVSTSSANYPVTMPVHVIHGRRDGPTMFVSAAIHGDEIIGVEIVRRLLRTKHLNKLAGTLLAVPIVNSLGFMNHSRYLPDRRDLNRCFPGSAKGALASRLANLFMNEIVRKSSVGIDMHSAAIHRTNLPQIRVSPSKPETMELAKLFGAPVILTSKTREGSLRYSAHEEGVDILLYEAGEGLRFDEFAVRAGVSGILRVMHKMQMIASRGVPALKTQSIMSKKSYWLRAPEGGLLRTYRTIGEEVDSGDVIGAISDPFGQMETEVIASDGGLIIGRANLPVVNEGDAIFHIAKHTQNTTAEDNIESLMGQLDAEPLFDEDEII
ncbi:succinylglutamate desuccinylase/aspartoacylase family protein [Kordiimonas aquimaris]|uniref:succinylglutamate desuccinylase/aspartoacylase family protein n=1 Tax=Kordiimonas aquimaris TaxID=707591 RepID=UPI0021CE45FD|nr:succinylglutamate desuccinylase/aspartoacylase family protein [Kordiimonas aquimaris]